jgi:hypothetical protein
MESLLNPERPEGVRALRLLIWAAKCHVHSQTTNLPLGQLPHSTAEVQAAIDAIEPAYRLEPCSDEGIKPRNYKR